MTTEIFQRCVQRLGLHIGKTYGRKALLFIENAPCHNIEEISASLRKFRVEFLPKNPTSILQPLDLGIIKRTKKELKPTNGTCGRCRRRRCCAKSILW